MHELKIGQQRPFGRFTLDSEISRSAILHTTCDKFKVHIEPKYGSVVRMRNLLIFIDNGIKLPFEK